MGVFKNLFDYSSKQIKKMTPIKDAVLALDEKYAAMSDEELQSVTPALKERLANGETLDDILPRLLAHTSPPVFQSHRKLMPGKS